MAGTRVVRLKRQTLESSEHSRKRQGALFGLSLLLIGVAFVCVVRYVAAGRQALNTTADVKSDGLYYLLSMKKSSYRPGEPIDIELLVTNVSPNPVRLQFESDLEYELTVEKDQDILIAQIPQKIWQLSKDSGHIPKFRPHVYELQPGERKPFPAIWPQTDFRGERVPPGRYTITGGLLAKNRPEVLRLRGTTKQ